jgi:uncharacterized protein (DUF427 family)
VSLTAGNAPFSPQPAGVFNFEPPRTKGVIYFDGSPRRVRAVFAGETVVDSRHAKLLHETGHLPIYYFPLADVHEDLLEPTDHSTRCPFKGQAAYWSIRAGGRVAENAAWGYDEPLADMAALAGHRALYWNRVDEWWEEDERAFVHARDPYHRVDVLDTSRHVRVTLDGEMLADTRRARVLFETSLPPRWYIPREDVSTELLSPSDTRTECPYKGTAGYSNLRLGDRQETDLAWCYEQPLREVEPIVGRLAFFDERVDTEIDGEAQERPRTRWSHGNPAGD